MKLFLTRAERIKWIGFDDRWVFLLGIFPVAALSNTLFDGWNPALSGREVLACYGISLVYTTIYWTLGRYTMLTLRRRFPRQDQVSKRVLASLVILFLVAFGVSYLSLPFLGNGLVNPEAPEPPLVFKVLLAYTIIILVLAIYEGAYFFLQYRSTLQRQEELARENMRTQLSALRQQMDPHFLFNSLNTLVHLIPEDSRKATLFTQRLSMVYRRILEYQHSELITLREELNALQDYIFLMQTRFEDKLIITFDFRAGPQVQSWWKSRGGEDRWISLGPWALPESIAGGRVVPLSLQLLVENAIKHNEVSTAKPLLIELIVQPDRILVRNRLQLRQLNAAGTGYGHENLNRRYAAVSGKELTIEVVPDTYTVTVPLLEPVDAAADRSPTLAPYA